MQLLHYESPKQESPNKEEVYSQGIILEERNGKRILHFPKEKEDHKYFGEFHPSRTANILLLLVVDKGLKED